MIKDNNSSFLDIISKKYGVEYLVEYLKSSNISNYDSISAVTYLTDYKLNKPFFQNYKSENNISESKIIFSKTNINETLIDCVLNNYGDLSKTIKLMLDLNLKNYADFRENIIFSKENIDNKYVFFLKKNNLTVNTKGNINNLGKIDTLGDFSDDFSEDYFI